MPLANFMDRVIL